MQPKPTTLFDDNPCEQSRFNSLRSNLFAQILPQGELELQTFERYAFAIHQASRLREFEIETQQRWTNEPNHPLWFLQMDRLHKLAALQERRADRALSELRKLQRDRIIASEVRNELSLMEQNIPVPATLPLAAMRSCRNSTSSPAGIALLLLGTTPEVQQLFEAKPAPPPPVSLTPEELLRLHRSAKNETNPIPRSGAL